MIYTGHLPASGDSFYVSVARSCNDPLSLCLPEPGRLSFREICRPRPQPIRSSAAPVKFTRQVYMAVSCVTRRGLLLVSRRVGGKNSAVARSRVSRCLGATTKKRQKEDVRDERAEPQRGEREPKGRLEPDTRKFVKEPFYQYPSVFWPQVEARRTCRPFEILALLSRTLVSEPSNARTS